ncbi:hypothetical protein B484DRAFT_429796 [Ochromonadaceae sp. CCMP2298]|nr:hypothetical protein B484DRAFT_429796 [Ochromonadaceae sp. CCMP2298]
MFQLNWNAIVDRFALKFEAVFSSSSKKAHFDCIHQSFAVIDGARTKWCNLLLVNAIIGILDVEACNLGTRRKFNQQKELCECIQEIRSTTNADDEDKVCVVSVEGEWSNISSLRALLDSDAPYKSKDKYTFIMNVLLNHKVLADFNFDLRDVISAAVRKILQFESEVLQPARPSMSNKRTYEHVDEASPKKPRMYEYSDYLQECARVQQRNPELSLDVDWAELAAWAEEDADKGAEAAKQVDFGLGFTFNAGTVFDEPQEAMLGTKSTTDSNPWDFLDAKAQPLSPLRSVPNDMRLCIDPSFSSSSGRTTPESTCRTSPGSCCSSPIRSPMDSRIPLDFLIPFPLHHSSFNTRRCFSNGSSPAKLSPCF